MTPEIDFFRGLKDQSEIGLKNDEPKKWSANHFDRSSGSTI
jgi:hypothetical protein